MLKKILFALGCLAVCVFGVSRNFVFAHAPSITNEAIVHMDETGFTPNRITINQGQTVVFENVGTEEHWPASNIHPTHAIFPEFDPQKGIPAKESWNFTFTKPGSWLFHDHLFPDNTGSVKVAATTSAAIEQPKEPSVQQRWRQFWDNLLLKRDKLYFKLFPDKLKSSLAKTNMHQAAQVENKLAYWLQIIGGQAVMTELVKDSGGGSVVDCHQEAHKTGRVAYSLFGVNVFRDNSYDCHSGYYHGAMEEFLKEKGTDGLAEKIESVCSHFATSFGNFECLHGVGHGVMATVDNNLPEALSICEQMKTSYTRSSCYGGAFMENIIVAEGNGAGSYHQTRWVSPDPLFPCNGVSQDSDVQTQCYLMQTSRMLDIKHDWDYLTTSCLTAPETMRDTCFQSLGRDAAGQTLRDPVQIESICKKVPAEYYDQCVLGSLYVVIEFWGENLTSQPAGLCQTFPQSKEFCYSSFGSRLPGVFGKNTEKIGSACGYAEKEYINTCRLAAGLKGI